MANNKRTEQNVITVGSCDVYIKPYEGEMPETADICKSEYKFGHTKNGATVKYEKEVTELTDDFGRVKRTKVNSEKVTMGFGAFGWNGKSIEKLVSTAKATDDAEKGLRVTEIGGVANDDGLTYVVCLHHIDAEFGDAWWMGIGKNTEGLELAYKPDDGTVAEPTFACEPYNDDGRLIKYIEEIAKEAEQNAG